MELPLHLRKVTDIHVTWWNCTAASPAAASSPVHLSASGEEEEGISPAVAAAPRAAVAAEAA